MSSLNEARKRKRLKVSIQRSRGRHRERSNVPAVAEKTSEDDKDVVDVVLLEDGVGNLLGRRHGLSNGSDVSWRIETELVSIPDLHLFVFDQLFENSLLFQVLLSTNVGRSAIPAIWYP